MENRKPAGRSQTAGRYSTESKMKKGNRKRQTLPEKSLGTRKRGSKAEELSLKIRLNRFIANSGVCSRRDADEHIKNGLITVNGKQVTDLGTKVTHDDDVRYKNKRLSAEKKVYILLNKPKDYVTTVEDPHAEHTVLDLIGDACPERVYPVGRLDKATTGVLLLTNDGDLDRKAYSSEIQKEKNLSCFSRQGRYQK